MNHEQFTLKAKQAIQDSVQLGTELGNQEIQAKLSFAILEGRLLPNSTVHIDFKNDKFEFS
jgi:hypothetical protein